MKSQWMGKTVLLMLVVGLRCLITRGDTSPKWQEQIGALRWVAYSPTHSDSDRGVAPSIESVREDLAVLRKANFTGLVTYSCGGPMGEAMVGLSEKAGFQGVIVGIWDIASTEELAAAGKVSSNSIVLGFCVGNEGYPSRYNLKDMAAAMDKVREITSKPVSTTGKFDDYSDEGLLQLGDWIFPNVHPYFHDVLEPKEAVDWTVDAYHDLKRRTDKYVWLKEVGLPTAGDKDNRLSEKTQEEYYIALAKTGIPFVYFEGFDLAWKTDLPVEAHWGVFHADRTPKSLVTTVAFQQRNNSSRDKALVDHIANKSATNSISPFYVYSDFLSESNHFTPSGLMGDCGDIKIDQNCPIQPYSGSSCIKVVYSAEGKGPHSCDYSAPCKWAGVYWQTPANNWGKDNAEGYDLSGYRRLVFRARADKECTIEFKVGGIRGEHGDSLKFPRSKATNLDQSWKEIAIDLKGANLKHIIGGFCWTSSQEQEPKGAVFYLDDIRFEK